MFLCLPFCLLWYRQGLLYDRRYGEFVFGCSCIMAALRGDTAACSNQRSQSCMGTEARQSQGLRTPMRITHANVPATGPARRALEARRRRERDALRQSLQQSDDSMEDEAPRELLTNSDDPAHKGQPLHPRHERHMFWCCGDGMP